MGLQLGQLVAVGTVNGDPAPLGDKADDVVARNWLAAAGNVVHQIAHPFHHYPAIVFAALLRRVGFLLQLLQRRRVLLFRARLIELRLQEVDHLVETNIAAANGRQQLIQLVEVVARQQLFGLFQADPRCSSSSSRI
jgi:hypothetical protein